MSIIPDLKWADHKRLRLIVQNVHMKNYPEGMMGPAEADRIIESLAPDILESWLRQKIDAREIA